MMVVGIYAVQLHINVPYRWFGAAAGCKIGEYSTSASGGPAEQQQHVHNQHRMGSTKVCMQACTLSVSKEDCFTCRVQV